MRRRSLITFIVLNVLITAAVIFAVTRLLNNNTPPPTTSQLVITVPILVTATTDPNAGPTIKIVTATPQPGTVILPTGILVTTESSSAQTVGTIDAGAVAINPSDAQSPGVVTTALPENCILHTLVEGDTPFGVAEQYGADPFKLMEVNGLNDETASLLQIGDTLIVPLEGCPLTGPVTTPVPTLEEASVEATAEITAEGTAEPTQGPTATPTLRPTLTLPPTATNAKVEIAEVIGAGQITTEGITIRNNGNNVNLKGWTIETSSGNVYTFAERILFSNGLVTVYSRVGQDTAIALFWNRTAPSFQPGDVVTLKDNNGKVQGSYRLPAPVTLP
ncbi:MAG: LysM peptidoglycan-binding domain-containing protein [Anaerolineaceae bacterium]|nr:LysM peptidoglycan-binding domain-containing protein [Anaerolineaceae bacterium]